MLYVSWCILYVSYMYPKQRMKYIRIHTEYTTIHVSTPSHMSRPMRLWDTPGYNRIHQDTSARAYPHRLHTIPPDTAGIRRRFFFAVAIFNSLGAPLRPPGPQVPAPPRSPPPRPHTTLPYVPRNSLKGAGSALGVQWVGGFSHGGGRVRRGLEWVLCRVPDLAAVHYVQPGRGPL